MASTDKPKSITIIVLDRSTKKSKSLTVYGSELEDVYRMVKKALG